GLVAAVVRGRVLVAGRGGGARVRARSGAGADAIRVGRAGGEPGGDPVRSAERAEPPGGGAVGVRLRGMSTEQPTGPRGETAGYGGVWVDSRGCCGLAVGPGRAAHRRSAPPAPQSWGVNDRLLFSIVLKVAIPRQPQDWGAGGAERGEFVAMLAESMDRRRRR